MSEAMKPNREESGKKCPTISCEKCSEKIDWKQANGENTIYDVSGWCVNCYDEEETRKEIERELKN